MLLAVTTLVPNSCIPPNTLPLAIRMDVLVPVLVLCLRGGEFVGCFLGGGRIYSGHLFTRNTRSTVMSTRVMLVLKVLRFVTVDLTVFFMRPLRSPTG